MTDIEREQATAMTEIMDNFIQFVEQMAAYRDRDSRMIATTLEALYAAKESLVLSIQPLTQNGTRQ